MIDKKAASISSIPMKQEILKCRSLQIEELSLAIGAVKKTTGSAKELRNRE